MKKILIIEDEKIALEALDRILEPKGYELVSARTGPDGLRLALETKPDLIVLDIILPGIIDGVEVLEKLREDAWGKNVKVIVLTNLTNKEEKERIKSFGVLDYIVKTGVSTNDIVDIIAAAVK